MRDHPSAYLNISGFFDNYPDIISEEDTEWSELDVDKIQSFEDVKIVLAGMDVNFGSFYLDKNPELKHFIKKVDDDL